MVNFQRVLRGSDLLNDTHKLAFLVSSLMLVVSSWSQEINSGNPNWSPDGAKIAFQSTYDGDLDIYEAWVDGSNPIKFFDSDVDELWPVYSPDGTEILYASGKDRKYDLFKFNRITGQKTQLTFGKMYGGLASWSSDGSKIAFYSDISGNFEIYSIHSDGTNLQQLTNHPDFDGVPSWNEDDSKILFQSEQFGEEQILEMNPDGSEIENITGHNQFKKGVARYVPGKKNHISYESRRSDNWDLYLLNRSTGKETRLTRSPALDVLCAWSPNGKFLAHEQKRKDGPWEITILDVETLKEEKFDVQWESLNKSSELKNSFGKPDVSSDGGKLVFGLPAKDCDLSIGSFFSPRWSSDGNYITFHSNIDSNREIYLFDVKMSSLKRLSHTEHQERVPVMSPDGKSILFFRKDKDKKYSALFTKDLFNGKETPLTSLNGTNLDPDWSPDMQQLAFVSSIQGSWEIHTMRPTDSTNFKQLTHNDAYDYSPHWSPDGNRIGYVSQKDGKDDIWVMDQSGNNKVNLTPGKSEEISFSWSPDGSKILYSSRKPKSEFSHLSEKDRSRASNNSSEIYLLDLKTNQAKQLTDNNHLDVYPSWSPNGNRAVFCSCQSGRLKLYFLDLKTLEVTPLTDTF